MLRRSGTNASGAKCEWRTADGGLGAASPAPRRSRAGDWWLFGAGVLVYVAAWLATYPRVPAIVDENAYLTQALLFRTGHVTYERSSIPAPQMSVETAGRTASKYPPGTSLFLVPFTLPGWRWVFVSGLVLALTGVLLFRRALARICPEAHPSWALLYLFYPAVVLYSRTAMSDLLAATAILAAFLFLLRIRAVGLGQRTGAAALWSGALLGYACLVRYSAAVLIPVFLVLFLAGQGRGLKKTFLFAAGLVPFGGAALAYNALCYGGALSFPMHLTGVFSPTFLPANLSFYLPVLLLLYPMMLAGPLLAGRGRVLLLGLPAAALILPYLFFSYTPGATAVGAVIGLRYLLPAIPFLLLGLVAFLHRVEVSVKGLRFLRHGMLLLAAAASVALQVRHDRYLAVQDRCRREVLTAVPEEALVLCHAPVSELFSVAWGWRDYRHIAEHNVPMMLEGAIAGRDTVCAAIIRRRASAAERAIFDALLAGFPQRVAVGDSAGGCDLEVYRLKSARPASVR